MLKTRNGLKENDPLKNDILDKLNEAQQIAKIGSWDWDMVTSKVWWSDELYRIFDLEKGVFIPDFKSNAKYVHPEDIESYLKEVERVFLMHESIDYDLRLISARGILKYCNLKGKINYNNSGKPVRFFGTFMDITERKKAEEKIRETNENLKMALQASKSGIWDWDIVNDIFHWSKEFRNLFGMSQSVMAGFEAWSKAVHPDDRDKASAIIQECINEMEDLQK